MARLCMALADDPLGRRLAWALFAALAALLFGFAIAELLVFLFSRSPDDLVAVRAVRDFIGLNRDRSFGECVCYCAVALGAGMFFVAYWRHRRRILLVLGLLMLFILVDDSMQYHERFGGFLVRAFDLGALPFLRAQDGGEVLAWSLAGAGFAALVVWAWRGRRAGDAGILRAILLAFLLLGLGGVGFDLLAIAAGADSELLGGLFIILEEAGEFFGLGAMVVIALAVLRHGEGYFALCAQDVQEVPPHKPQRGGLVPRRP